MKRTGTVAMCKLDNHTVLEKDFIIIREMTLQVNWYTVSAACANPVWNTLTTISIRWMLSKR